VLGRRGGDVARTPRRAARGGACQARTERDHERGGEEELGTGVGGGDREGGAVGNLGVEQRRSAGEPIQDGGVGGPW
jgi:hypothetical protein